MKVYIVTGGEYSSYSIYAVFLNEEKAKMYVAVNPGTDIEEYDTFDDNIIGKLNSKIFYHVTIYGDGHKYKAELKEIKSYTTPEYKLKYSDEINLDGDLNSWSNIFEIDVDTEDKEKAVKIAYDKRIEFLAKKYGFNVLPEEE